MHAVPDLAREELQPLLPGRALRTYPAILSTEADAMAWARQGGPHGAVVVAGYQASPRGRAGLAWGGIMEPGHGLGMSMILRPRLAAERAGWLYTACLLAAMDAMDDPELVLEWPDRVVRDRATAAAIGIQDDTTAGRVSWAVTSVLVPGAEPPRGELLARLVDAIDTRLGQDPTIVLADYRQRCATLGRRVRARLLPLGSAGPVVDGVAADVTEDGGVTIRTDDNRRVVVLPQALGFVEDPDAAPPGPDRG